MYSEDITVVENFITAEEENALKVELVDKYFEPPSPNSSSTTTSNQIKIRQAVRFGTFNPCSSGLIVSEVPDIVKMLKHRLVEQKIVDREPESTSLNLYAPGTVILPHIDNFLHCEERVVIINFLGDGDHIYRYAPKGVIAKTPNEAKSLSVHIPSRSMVLLKGDKRYNWTHETVPQPHFRASLTFRLKKPSVMMDIRCK